MNTLSNRLLAAIDRDDLPTATEILTSRIDLNVPCVELDGAPVLFLAILKGNCTMVRLLLDHGADPNYRAEEPVASTYTAKPLNLARQSRMLFDWEKYDAIVKLLEEFGATDENNEVESKADREKSKVEAKNWQSRNQNS